MMCQCRFIHFNKCTPLLGVLIMGETMHGVGGAGGMWEISVLSAHVCCESKTSLKKKKVLKKTKK